MKDEETVAEYIAIIYDISNESYSFGETIDNARLVSKVLRTLPERFSMKILAIEETHDLTTMKLDELLGYLRTHQMSLKEKEHKLDNKTKEIALKAETGSEEELDYNEQFALLAKNFGKFMRKVNHKKSDQGQQYSPSLQNRRDGNSQKKNRSGEDNNNNKGDKPKRIQCF